MYGAVAGDFAGSRFEFAPIRSREFEIVHGGCFWTDDTVLTVAVADGVANGRDMAESLRWHALEHVASYGHSFWDWANGRLGPGPYGSWGNGAAMRVSPAAWFARDVHECLRLAEESAVPTHNHPEGIRGARAVALAIYAGLSGWRPDGIRALVSRTSGYDLSAPVAVLQQTSAFELKSWVSVPYALSCALEARTVEDAIRNAVWLGGDADTEAAIAASIVETWSPVPERLREVALSRLPPELREALVGFADRASAVRRRPLGHAEAAALAAWDPAEVERWDARLRELPRTLEDVEAERWLAFERGLPPARPARGKLFGRLFGR